MKHLLLLFLLPLTLATAAGQTIFLQPGQWVLDEEGGMLLARMTPGMGGSALEVKAGNDRYVFQEPVQELSTDISYAVEHDGKTYQLHFTRLPVFQITAERGIVSWTKVECIGKYADDEQTFEGEGLVRWRGGFSLNLPKKSMDLEFDEDVRFGNLREDDDWVLDALYNEPLRLNAYVGHQLWLDQHQLYYADREPDAKPGAGVFLVETFLNGRYYGLQMLSEQIDRKQLKLKKFREGQRRGELYKGADGKAGTLLRPGAVMPDNTSEEWSGFEYKYPDSSELLNWNNLYDYYDFVSSASDEDFRAGIGERFNLDNAIDYLLFINVTYAFDNQSKNIYTARYKVDEPYINLIWDLDGTFGNFWNGEDAPETDVWLNGEGLYKRLVATNPEQFNTRLCDRYNELRTNLYTADALKARFTAGYELLTSNNVIAREEAAWPDGADATPARLQYTYDWIDDRLVFLDGYICDLAVSTEETTVGNQINLYPNPASSTVTVEVPYVRPETYVIRSMLGRQVASGRITDPSSTIDVSMLPSGSYVIRIGRYVRKLVVR